MHVVIVTDQHPGSLGGAQVSITLQRTYLERLGHTVSVVAPRRLREVFGERSTEHPRVGHDIELPAIPITRDRDYGASWPGRSTVRRVMDRLKQTAPPVDIVHVQGDFWGALIGYQLAERLGVPVVNTMHNNLDVGTRAVTPFAGFVFVALQWARRMLLGPKQVRGHRARGGWAYLAELAARSAAVVAPSAHFARELARHGIAGPFEVIATGVDDDLIDLMSLSRRERATSSTRFVWCGRMSPEKRLMELLTAFRTLLERGVDAELVVVGTGLQRDEAVAFVERANMSASVRFTGALTHEEALEEIFLADALVQTSIGFDTQGMTPYEAKALGTPTVFCDANIAAEVQVAPAWRVQDTSVDALTQTLIDAAGEIRAGKIAGQELRVPTVLRDEIRQSRRTEEMLRVYARVLREAAPR